VPDPTFSFLIVGVVWAAVLLRSAYKSGFDKARQKYAPPPPPPAKIEVYKARPPRVGSSRRKARPTAARP
jgi:hypothetical protein